MNEVINNILTRQSIRDFTDKKISIEELKLLVEAARHAPSGKNKQLWKFTVVQNPDMIKELAAVIAKVLNKGNDYNFYAPNALIIASNDKDDNLGEADCACALENIFLAANSLGIGSVWINQFRGICDEPEIRKVLDKIKLPSNHIIWGVAALGYPGIKDEKKIKRVDVVEWIL